jgi:hypothetical protein
LSTTQVPGVRQGGDGVGAVGVGDVDLDRHQVRLIVQAKRLDVLVDDHGLVLRTQAGGQRRQAQRREQRVLDWPPGSRGGFDQGGQDELDAHAL